MSVKNRNSIVTDGLVFYVDAGNEDSYAGSGGTWSDLVGGNDGTFSATSTTDSANGGSIVFDGVDDYYRYDVDWTSYNDITAIAWIKKSSYSSGWETYFSYASEEGGLTKGWGIRRSGYTTRYQLWGGTDNTGIQLYVNDVLNNYGTGTTRTTDYNVNILNEWQQISITAQGVTNFQYNRLGLGARNDTFSGSYSNSQISNFKVYNRVLTAQEITQNYNALKNRFI